jgi:energy-coupling factor transporter ATP-binding protein EcfA2
MSVELDRSRLIAAEKLESARAELTGLREHLRSASHWRPARGLVAQCDEALTMIDAMGERLRRKLVVALVGPTGAGKSTLLNALAGIDRLSVAGSQRPTTRQVVAFCRDRSDAEPLIQAVGGERVDVVSSPSALSLEHVVLVDTPDTNSSLLAQHRVIVEAVIGQADVLVAIFNAENPKARVNIDYLAPFVAAFPSEFVLAVLNHCDRQDEQELKKDIIPDFVSHLEASWGRRFRGQSDRLFCISARRNLRQPNWPEGALPRHGFDQFDNLKEVLFGSINRASVVVDARVQRAEHLVNLVRGTVAERIAAHHVRLGSVRERIDDLQESALKRAVASLQSSESNLTVGSDALFYQRLSQLWWGPVGWLVGLWARLLLVGAGAINIIRFGNPLRQLWGTVTSLVRFSKTRKAMDEATQGSGAEAALLHYQLEVERRWPGLADKLVAAGFDPGVRESRGVVADTDALGQAIEQGWAQAFGATVEQVAKRLSGWMFQLVLNFVVLVPIGVVVYQSIEAFARGQTLSGEYFNHALITIVLVWLLSFVVFQIRARRAGGHRLLARTFDKLLNEMTGAYEAVQKGWVRTEIEAVQGIGRQVGAAKRAESSGTSEIPDDDAGATASPVL